MNTLSFTDGYEIQYTTNDYTGSSLNVTSTSSLYLLNSTLDSTNRTINSTNSESIPAQALKGDLYNAILYVVILVASIVPVSMVACVVLYFSLSFIIKKVRQWTTDNEFRPEVLSVIHKGEASDNPFFRSNDEMQMIDAASSIYPGDQLPSCCIENSVDEKVCTDTVTTPLSNNSIITMTMRNNHLIVETEERIPINLSCSLSSPEELLWFSNNRQNISNAYSAPHIGNSLPDDLLDDLDDYLIGQRRDYACTVNEDRPFFEPTTSRQADEDDQHIEFFHKNILVVSPDYCHQETETVPSCSYNCANSSSPFYGPVTTGYSQSDLTGSSSCTSRHQAQVDYCYGNQCEYMSCEYPLRKRSSTCRMPNYDKSDDVMIAVPFSYTPPPSHTHRSPENSVLQVTDCSPQKCFESPEK